MIDEGRIPKTPGKLKGRARDLWPVVYPKLARKRPMGRTERRWAELFCRGMALYLDLVSELDATAKSRRIPRERKRALLVQGEYRLLQLQREARRDLRRKFGISLEAPGEDFPTYSQGPDERLLGFIGVAGAAGG